MPFDINKCHILQVDTSNQKSEYKLNGTKLESVQCVKDRDAKIASNLKFSQLSQDAAGKANRILGFIKKNFSL